MLSWHAWVTEMALKLTWLFGVLADAGYPIRERTEVLIVLFFVSSAHGERCDGQVFRQRLYRLLLGGLGEEIVRFGRRTADRDGGSQQLCSRGYFTAWNRFYIRHPVVHFGGRLSCRCCPKFTPFLWASIARTIFALVSTSLNNVCRLGTVVRSVSTRVLFFCAWDAMQLLMFAYVDMNAWLYVGYLRLVHTSVFVRAFFSEQGN